MHALGQVDSKGGQAPEEQAHLVVDMELRKMPQCS
jgi:hypothetical protein